MTLPVARPLPGPTPATETRSAGWTLARMLALAVTAGYAFLFLDVRYEHAATLAEHPTAWIPVAFAAVAVPVGLLAVALWQRGGRWAFAILSLLAFLVGFVGVWHHTDGNPLVLLRVLNVAPGTVAAGAAEPAEAAGAGKEGSEEAEEEEEGAAPAPALSTPSNGETIGRVETAAAEAEGGAPLLAPLAFAGMGLFGLLAASRPDRERSW